MDALLSTAPNRHPWLSDLTADPAQEVRKLVAGTAHIHPYGRAEPSDAAATLLFDLEADDPAVLALDQGAIETLVGIRTATAQADSAEIDQLALSAFDLMKVIQRLTPPQTVVDLHRRFSYWNAWAETLVIDRGLDLRREYYRTLALTQNIAEEAGLGARRLLPFWLYICREAGTRGRYGESYLAVGLVGLRSLPLGDEGGNEEASLHGLARWADAQRPSKKRFLREWRVLEGAFPRDPTFWTELVARVLAATEGEIVRYTKGARDTFPAAEWWREDVDVMRGAFVAPRGLDLEPPPRELHEGLLDDIRVGKAFKAIEPRLRSLIERHERYAIRSGDTFYLVRTACNIGMRLLGSGDEPALRAERARDLARLVLRFEPADIFAWALWSDSLAAEGYVEAAELVGWETIRLFPQLPNQRTRLALLLTGRADRPHAAEALLRETMRLFPDNVVARNQLASILGREQGRLAEAIAVLEDALTIEPDNRIAKTMKRRFEEGHTSSPATAKMWARDGVGANASNLSVIPAEIAQSGRLRRALFRQRTASQDEQVSVRQEVETLLREDENFAYARYVATAAGIRGASSEDTVLAAAFLAAADHDPAAFAWLSRRASGTESVVIHLTGASRGDPAARAALEAWMGEPANDLSPRDTALRELVERMEGPLPIELAGDMLAASLGHALAA